LLDEAESQLGAAVRRGEGWAVCFLLKTRGRERGYVERSVMDVNAKVMTVADLVRNAAALEASEDDDLEN
jgi:hypothetical protein